MRKIVMSVAVAAFALTLSGGAFAAEPVGKMEQLAMKQDMSTHADKSQMTSDNRNQVFAKAKKAKKSKKAKKTKTV